MGLNTLDWTIIAIYLAFVFAIGFRVARQHGGDRSFFLADRSFPVWAVALSVMATNLSAATYISSPEISFRGNLAFLLLPIGTIPAGYVIAYGYLPKLYAAGTVTVYGYLGRRYGFPVRMTASLIYLLGRMLAGGARLFIAAIAFSLVLYGDTSGHHLVAAIMIFGLCGILYTTAGGLRAVVWTDTLQITLVAIAASCSIYLLLQRIPLNSSEIMDLLRADPGGDKLMLFDWRFSLSEPFTVWALLIGAAVSQAADYGSSQDTMQRLFAAKSSHAAVRSLVYSAFITVPVVLLFLIIGLLLYIFYTRPDIMGGFAPDDPLLDPKGVFPQFLLNHLPPGFKGLAIAGVFAAAMSTVDSNINSMASTVVTDIYEPLKGRDGSSGDPQNGNGNLTTPRVAVIGVGLALVAFACLAVYMHSRGVQTLISFALGIFAFATAPLFGVMTAAVWTTRGNNVSVITALVAGLIIVLLLQPYMLPRWIGIPIAWSWWWVITCPIVFGIAVAGKPGRAEGKEGV